MAEKYERVLELMKTRGGRLAINDPELIELLGPVGPKGTKRADGTPSVWYRLPTFIHFIRKRANLDVRGLRKGRLVESYELVASSMDDGIQDDSESSPATL